MDSQTDYVIDPQKDEKQSGTRSHLHSERSDRRNTDWHFVRRALPPHHLNDYIYNDYQS